MADAAKTATLVEASCWLICVGKNGIKPGENVLVAPELHVLLAKGESFELYMPKFGGVPAGGKPAGRLSGDANLIDADVCFRRNVNLLVVGMYVCMH